MRRITLLQVLGYWNLHSGGYKLRTVGYEMRTTPACAEWPICRCSRRVTLGFIFILRNRCGWVAPSPSNKPSTGLVTILICPGLWVLRARGN